MKTLDALNWIQNLRREEDAHKGDVGKVLLIGGAQGMAGALVLAGQAALYSGAGWVQLMVLDDDSAHVDFMHPELMVHKATKWLPDHALVTIKPDVVAIGPGLGLNDKALAWLASALKWDGPLILDADALNLLGMHNHLLLELRQRKTASVITPHPGEAARLLANSSKDIQANREKSLERLIELTGSTVVLKGHHSLVGAENQASVKCLAGNAGMAVGGMGDVLTGCLAALIAQGIRHHMGVYQCSCLAVQLHALAGDQLLSDGIGPVGMTASELARQIRNVINAQLT